MGIRNIKPVTPGSRFASRPDFADITTSNPEKKADDRPEKERWS